MADFDPETSGTAFDPETSGQPFDIESAGSPASPSDRLQALAPLVAKPDSTPTDERAYADAYKEYYNQNSRGAALGSAIGSVASSVGGALIHPIDAGAHLWNVVKAGWNSDALGGPNASNEDKTRLLDKAAFRTMAGDPTALIGAAKGAGGAIWQTANTAGSGIEQWANLAADLKSKALTGVGAEDADNAREFAAQNAIQRLKMGQKAAQILAPPTNQTGSDAATSAMGSALGSAAIGAALPGSSALADTSQAAGDFVGNVLTKAAGVALKGVQPATNTAIAGAKGYAALKGLEALGSSGNPMELIGDVMGAGVGHKVVNAINSIKPGLFARANALGDQLIATPMGQSAIDSIVSASDERIMGARQDLLGYRADVQKLEEAKTAAQAGGDTTIPLTKQLKKANAVEDAGNLRVHVMEQGAGVARYLQSKGVSGITSKLADAVSNAITGGLVGGAIGSANSQPGQRTQAANDAYVGGVLGMLGTAALGSHDTVAQGEIGDLTPTPPRISDTPTAPSTGSPAVDALSDLRKTSDRLATNTFVLDGVPHDTASLADSLNKVSKDFTNAARKDNPGETHNIPTTPAFGAEHQQTIPSDKNLLDLKSQWKPPPLKNGKPSSVFSKIAYDPDQMAWSGEFTIPGHADVHHYYGPDMLPEEYNAWMNAESVGKHFNSVIKKQFPVIRVHDGPTGLADANAIARKQGFKSYADLQDTSSQAGQQ